MNNFLSRFPTEKLILHKSNGESHNVIGLVGTNEIDIDDTSIVIEENDYFERTLPNGAKEYYLILDRGFYKGMGSIPDLYKTKVKKIDSLIDQKTDSSTKVKKKIVFISHSSKDSDYTQAFVDMLFDIGLSEECIVCSSYPGVGVPLGAKVYEWLVEKFQVNDLHVFFFLSKNYYDSAASLNEMGAAWAMKQKWDGVLLPGFDFKDIRGCIDSTQICIKLDGDQNELKHRLGEMKQSLIEEFDLKTIPETRWETVRERFIEKVLSIPVKIHIDPIKESHQHDYAYDDNYYSNLDLEASVMLFFACESDGHVYVDKDLSGTEYIAGNKPLNASNEHRELAKWDDALNSLIKGGYVKCINEDQGLYEVTSHGYNINDAFADANDLDPDLSVSELIDSFK